MQDVLLLYSGGKDSLLSAYYLLKEGYHVYLIHYDNCSMIGTEQIQRGANLLEERFGKDKITFLGIAPIIGIINRMKKIENIPISDILSQYGDITLSQYQCLLCRSAMYYYSCVIANDMGIKYIAEGARKSQLFAIEQPPLMEAYRELLNKYDLELLTPVYDIEDDIQETKELLFYEIWDCVSESQCMLGYHLDKEVSNKVIAGTKKIFESIIEPEFNNLMENEEVQQRYKYMSKHLAKDYVHWI